MIRYLDNLPTQCALAFSGGVDSVAIADFLLNGKRDVKLAFFHHGTLTSARAHEFVTSFARERGVELVVGRISHEKPKEKSLEEFWRDERQDFFRSFERTVITAHHLDDAIETWIFTSLHGNPRVIPIRNGNVFHPFLITRKHELKSWCERRSLTWIEDQSNNDTRFMRNLIRHEIMPNALKVNPGLHKVIKRKYDELMRSSAT